MFYNGNAYQWFVEIQGRYTVIDQFSRTRLTLGGNGVESLQKAHVIVFGCGGVGGYVCESLVRSGLGTIDIVDDDKVCLTNINRQIIATWKTVGMDKVDAMEERLLDINPSCIITKHKCFEIRLHRRLRRHGNGKASFGCPGKGGRNAHYLCHGRWQQT